MPQVKELFLDKFQIEKAVCGVYQIEVADLLKLMKSFSSVSSVITRIKQVMDRDKNLRQRITAVEKLLT